MKDRRSFFKGLATFASGVVAAKVAQYTPKKEEKKEEVMVSSVLTIRHDGKEYHPLVVEKTSYDGMKEHVPANISHSFAFHEPEFKIRKADI